MPVRSTRNRKQYYYTQLAKTIFHISISQLSVFLSTVYKKDAGSAPGSRLDDLDEHWQKLRQSDHRPWAGPQRKRRQAHGALGQLQQMLGQSVPLLLGPGATETADRFTKRLRPHRIVEVPLRQGHPPRVCKKKHGGYVSIRRQEYGAQEIK